jgi:hypothetical protein
MNSVNSSTLIVSVGMWLGDVAADRHIQPGALDVWFAREE